MKLADLFYNLVYVDDVLASIPNSKVGCGFGNSPKVLIQVTYAKFWELNALALAQLEGHC